MTTTAYEALTAAEQYEVTLASGEWPFLTVTVAAASRSRARTKAKRLLETEHPDRVFVVIESRKL